MGRPRKHPVEVVPVKEVDPNEEFLKGFLADGPIMRSNVFRESDAHGLLWGDVKDAFARLHGREYVQRGDFFWRIMPE